jgi:hypothetical protein
MVLLPMAKKNEGSYLCLCVTNSEKDFSMTSLLERSVAELTEHRFLPNLVKQFLDLIQVLLRMSQGKAAKFDFQSQFYVSKISQMNRIFFLLKIYYYYLGDYRLVTMRSTYFCQLIQK